MLVESILLLGLGLVLLTGGSIFLVQGASALAGLLRVSPLVIGLTIVAYGTSTPELVVSVDAALNDQPGIALGNVVGSNVFNILGILGVSALVAPLVVSSRLVRIDVPLMIGGSVLLLLMALDGNIGRVDGALLVTGLLVYTVLTWLSQRRKNGESLTDEQGPLTDQRQFRARTLLLNTGLAAIGLVMLGFGAQQTVASAVGIGESLRINSLIIGLTVVAAGTSLPELATSVAAVFKGERDLAVGNVIGSNIFNILGVQGLASLVSVSGVAVDPSVLRFDLLVMIAASVACLPIFFTGYAIMRWEGALFLGYFVAYLTYLYVQAAQREALGIINVALIAFVVPLTAITLTTVALRELRKRR